MPSQVLSPVSRDLEVVSSSEQCSGTRWCFNQHQSGAHVHAGGICRADDTYAWDANLNTPAFDADAGQPVFAVEQGVVAETYGGCQNAGGSYGQLLVEHDHNGATWWSGYLHLSDIQVVPGEHVTEDTVLGYVSDTSPDSVPNHLHFVVYKGENTRGGLVSFDAQLGVRSRTYRTEVWTDWPMWLYTFAIEGRSPIRLLVDGDLLCSVRPGSSAIQLVQKTVLLRRGCHVVDLEYGPSDDLPRLGFSRWPSPPDFETGLPPCQKGPPDTPGNTPDGPVRAFFGAMDHLDVDAAVETILPVPPWYRQLARWSLELYVSVLESLDLVNDFSQLTFCVASEDGASARVLVSGSVTFRNSEREAASVQRVQVEWEVPVSRLLGRWYIDLGRLIGSD